MVSRFLGSYTEASVIDHAAEITTAMWEQKRKFASGSISNLPASFAANQYVSVVYLSHLKSTTKKVALHAMGTNVD